MELPRLHLPLCEPSRTVRDRSTFLATTETLFTPRLRTGNFYPSSGASAPKKSRSPPLVEGLQADAREALKSKSCANPLRRSSARQ